MKRAPRSRQRHDLYAKYHDYDSEISDLLGECGLVEVTQGYPFFIQEWAALAWNIANDGARIEIGDVKASYEYAISALDKGFFKVRYDRLTKAEIRFVSAMADLGDGPYQMGDIAKQLGTKVQSLGPARASIIHKGMIYSTDHGYLDYTVPLFADFMRRNKADG